MVINLPSDESTSDHSVFGGRIDLYEAYWLYVDGVRVVGPVLKQSEATKEDTDYSPLARHYNHFYVRKEEHKKKCRKLPGGLPKYKEHFQEPRGDVRKVPRKNLRDLGIVLNEGDDPIWLPPEYELPSVWEDDIENMDKAGLKELVRKLRAEKTEIENERDEINQRLAEIGKSVSNYIDLIQSNEASQQKLKKDPSQTCEKCGRTFDSVQAKYGHSSHCDGSNSPSNSSSQGKTDVKQLEQLAEELPQLNEKQSAEPRADQSKEDELENLNHLLKGSL